MKDFKFWKDWQSSGNLRHVLFLIGVFVFLVPWDSFAGGDASKPMQWGKMSMELVGGLAVFLYGMELMADALKVLAGDRMKMILAKLTTNPISGAATGAVVTAVIQSSSVTTVLVVGFITAGVMTFQQSLGVIFGANIGTTITAQIVAFKVTEAASLMVAFGFMATMLGKKESVRQYGFMVMGLGLIFMGMTIMGHSMQPLRSYQPFLDLMISMETPLIGILIATAFTAIVQSSSATTGIIIVMATQGLITLPAGIALAFGANIGTCATALLAVIGKPREAVRAAIAHLLFNVIGVIIWYFFIPTLAEFVTWMSPLSQGLEGQAKLAAETPRQIANAHTMFNVVNTIIFLPFIGAFSRLINWMLPSGKAATGEAAELQEVAFHLNDILIQTPTLALEAVRREVKTLGLRVHLMMESTMPILLDGDKQKLANLAEMDDKIDGLYHSLIHYLGRISQSGLTEHQAEEMMDLVNVVSNMEAIGDIIETNIVRIGELRLEKGVEVGVEKKKNLIEYHKMITRAVDLAVRAITEEEGVHEIAQTVRAMQAQVDQQLLDASIFNVQRLTAEAPTRVEAFSFGMDVMEHLSRIYYCARNIVDHAAGEASYTKDMSFGKGKTNA